MRRELRFPAQANKLHVRGALHTRLAAADDAMIAITNVLHVIVKWLAAIALLLMMGLTFVDVNLRYWLGQPILGSNEMTEYLLGTIVFAGLVIVTGERSHIVVTLFEPFFERNLPRFYFWLGIVTNIAGILAVTYLIMNYSYFMYTQGNDTEIRHWQWWWLGALMSVLCVFAILMSIRAIKNPIEAMRVTEDSGSSGDEKAKPETGIDGAAL